MSDLGWLELYFDGLVGDDTGYEEVEWAIKEIERLQRFEKAYEELEKTHNRVMRVSNQHDEARDKQIEELEGKVREATKRVPCRLCSVTILVPMASVAEYGYCTKCGDRLREEGEELGKRIQDREDKFNAPCADALEKLWKAIMPPNYGDWEYPGQAYRHLKAEFDDQQKRIDELEEALTDG